MKLYYKISHYSEISDNLYTTKDEFEWYTGRKNDQFQVKGFSQHYIEQDSFLKYMSTKIPGTLKLFKFPPNCCYRWHRDGENLYNFNLVFSVQDAFVLFENKNENADFFFITP